MEQNRESRKNTFFKKGINEIFGRKVYLFDKQCWKKLHGRN